MIFLFYLFIVGVVINIIILATFILMNLIFDNEKFTYNDLFFFLIPYMSLYIMYKKGYLRW